MRPCRPSNAIVLVLVLSACESALDLPPSPVVVATQPPRVTSVEPPAAYGGETIELEGEHLGAAGETVRVRFGGAEQRAVQAGDGTRLSVLVPRDASDGHLRVETRGGEVLTDATFDFLGPDALARHVVVARADLRPEVQRVWPLEDGEMLLRVGEGVTKRRWLRRTREGSLVASGNVDGVTVDGATQLELVQSRSCTPDRNALVLRSVEDGTERTICLENVVSENDTYANAIAVDPGGRWLGITAPYGRTWIVDLSDELPSVRRLELDSSDQTLGIWPIGDERFLLAGKGGGRIVDAKTASASTQRWRPGSDLLTAAAAADGRVAIGTDDGRIHVVDAAQWPPLEERVLDALTDHPITSIALAGEHVAASVKRENALLYWDLRTPSAAPTTSLVAEEAQEVTAGRGLFAVGVRGGVVFASASTGLEVARRAVPAGLVGVTVREGSAGPVIEVASSTMRRTLLLDATTLERKEGFATKGELVAVAALPRARGLVALTRHALEGIGEDGATLAPIPLPSELLVLALRLSPDGHAAFVLAEDEATGRATVVVADLAGRKVAHVFEPVLASAWDLVAGPASFGVSTWDMEAEDVQGAFEVFDTAAALRGETKRLGDAVAATATATPLSFGGAAWLVDPGVTTVRVDFTTGLATPAPAFPAIDGYLMASSPSGRRVYSIDSDRFGQRQIHGWVLDPATGAVREQDEAMAIGHDAHSLAVLPDGAGLAIVNAGADELLLVE